VSILGNRVLRKEDPKFLTTGGTYVDDLPLDGAGHVVFVRSTAAHARIASVDVDEARTAPGVIGVFTAADVDLERLVGEPVVAVVAETRAQGLDAAELVYVDYEPLPVVVDPEDALTDATVLHPAAGTNLVLDLQFGNSGDDLFDGCDVVVRQRIRNQRVAPCPLEVRAGAAQWGDDGRVTYWCTTQGAHTWKRELAKGLEVAEDQVRIISPDVGGGFGAKIHSYPEDILVPWLARHLGRPLRWVETRSESMVSLGHGRGQIQDVELGGTRDGKVLAYRLQVLADGGAYARLGSLLPYMTRTMLTGVYDIPKGEFNAKTVVTNTTPTVAYRGAGRPEATAAIERTMDVFATEIGMDPAEVRRRNLVPASAFPYPTPTGTTYDIGDYERALDLLLDAAGYAGLRAEQAARRQSGDVKQLGIGLAVYVEITNVENSSEFASVEVRTDGTAVVRTGTSPHGQGHVTAWAMLASEQLGIPIDDIEVIHGDTDQVRSGGGTSGSRSLQAGGVAVNQAAVALVDKARQRAADLLEANPDDVVLDRVEARFHVAGTPAISKSWAELAAGDSEPLEASVDFNPTGATFPFGAHLALVEVDTETGKCDLQRIVAVDDAGRILNPLLAEGQIHGGLAQGIAQALFEEVRYDDDGNPVTSNLADYAFPSAAELPSFETVSMETPTPLNELGAKGIGESGTIGSTPAVQNAVIDAVAHLGVRHIDMPASPERVWRAIIGAGEPPTPTHPGAAAGTGSVDA
jgi:carbon-monoxide dehydrogenase large subunit